MSYLFVCATQGAQKSILKNPPVQWTNISTIPTDPSVCPGLMETIVSCVSCKTVQKHWVKPTFPTKGFMFEQNILFLIAFPHKALCLLYCSNKMALPSWKTHKTLWFYLFLMPKPSFLLYCTKKSNLLDQKCCTVPKKHRFLDLGVRRAGLSQASPWPMV